MHSELHSDTTVRILTIASRAQHALTDLEERHVPRLEYLLRPAGLRLPQRLVVRAVAHHEGPHHLGVAVAEAVADAAAPVVADQDAVLTAEGWRIQCF